MMQANTESFTRPPTAVAALTAADPVQVEQYLSFVLNAEVFAIGILGIKEIIEYAELTAVPMTPHYVRGVINLRGAAVPVIDLSVRFGRPASAVTKRTCIVIVEIAQEGGRQDIGVVVDTVNAVLDIPAADIGPAPNFGTGIRTDFVQGMAKVAGRFVILLEINQLLATEALAVLSEPELDCMLPGAEK